MRINGMLRSIVLNQTSVQRTEVEQIQNILTDLHPMSRILQTLYIRRSNQRLAQLPRIEAAPQLQE